MDKLISCWINVQTLPENYILPRDRRPGKVIVPPCYNIPVIDLTEEGHDRTSLIKKIAKASQDFGFFQVINHGVSKIVMEDAMALFEEFFDMPAEEKASLYSEDPSQSCSLCTSGPNYDKEEVHFWRDNLRHPSNPSEECMKSWPQKPTRYREVVGKYSVEVRKLSLRILELISEGLGLESGYFGDELSKEQLLSINHYPQCPEPSLALGMPKHCDPNLLTILQQGDVYGLQVFNNGQWIGVEPLPNAFVINIGYQLQIISNGILKSVEHRAVTNSNNARTTIGTFFYPCYDTIVEPANALIGRSSPLVYRAFEFKEFLANYIAKGGDTETVLEPYKLQA